MPAFAGEVPMIAFYSAATQQSHPSGHMTLKQHRILVDIRSLHCSKLNFDVVPTPSTPKGRGADEI